MDKGDTATFSDEADFVVDQDASPPPQARGGSVMPNFLTNG